MPSAAPQTPQEFITSLQNEGVILAKQDKLFFIPLEILNKCKFPEAFQNGTDDVNPDFFSEDGNRPAGLVLDSLIFRNLNKVLSQFRVADGVSQAVWLGAVQNNAQGKPESRAAESGQVLFVYTNDKKKIVVDMTKGGRPSNR
jgi:hypothetical protein